MRLRSSTRQKLPETTFSLSPVQAGSRWMDEDGSSGKTVCLDSTALRLGRSPVLLFGDCLPHAVVRNASFGCDVLSSTQFCNL